MKYESDNYELAKQDREEADKNMIVGKSDLAMFLLKQGQGDKMAADGVNDDDNANYRNEIDEEMLLDMCKFSNMSTANNIKKCSGNGIIERRNGGAL